MTLPQRHVLHRQHRFIVTINILWLFHTVLWVGLQYVIVVFPDYTRLLFYVGKHEQIFLSETTSSRPLYMVCSITKYTYTKFVQISAFDHICYDKMRDPLMKQFMRLLFLSVISLYGKSKAQMSICCLNTQSRTHRWRAQGKTLTLSPLDSCV